MPEEAEHSFDLILAASWNKEEEKKSCCEFSVSSLSRIRTKFVSSQMVRKSIFRRH
jgi:hypothetical protein